MILPLLIGFLLGVAAIIFAFQNTEVVSLSFLGWQFESSLALLVLMALTTGVVISVLVSLPSFISTSLRVMGLKKDNKRLAEELEARRRSEVVVTESSSYNSVLDIR